MVIELFIRGIAIGFAVAAPVGPIGMLVIRRTLAEGRLIGLLTGLGAAVADACYGSVGAFGLNLVTSVLVGYVQWTRLVGGLFLCYLGISTYRAAPAENGTSVSSTRYAEAFFATLLLTLANPITILSFTAILAGLGLGNRGGDYGAAAAVVAGVFLGSALWWLLLSGGVSLLKHRLKPETMRWINRISGVVLCAFGVTALAGLIR